MDKINKKEKTLGEKCIELHPDRIPVIISYDNDIIFINSKYKEAQTRHSQMLVQNDTTVGYLCMIIGRNAKINKIENIHIGINGVIMHNANSISELYSKYKNLTDGCLHITIGY